MLPPSGVDALGGQGEGEQRLEEHSRQLKAITDAGCHQRLLRSHNNH